MTRFARAAGSKGSNEKRPEEGTSWLDLKKGILEKKDLKNDTDVAEEESLIEEVKSVWAELSNTKKKKKLKSDHPHSSVANEGKVKKNVKNQVGSKHDEIFKKEKKINNKRKQLNDDCKLESIVDDEVTEKTKKKKKSSKLIIAADPDEELDMPKKKKMKKSIQAELTTNKFDTSTPGGRGKASVQHLNDEHSTLKQKKKKKLKGISESPDIPENNDGNVIKKKKLNKFSPAEHSDTAPSIFGDSNEAKNDYSHTKYNDNSTAKKEKQRRKAELSDCEVMINGQRVRISSFDRFPVLAEDAERLRQLRKDMLKRKIPDKDREAAIKLERRRAEKALARLKKKVCFHCRKSGHNLSECPQVDRDQSATGICYKCGSTEHTYFQCRVTRGQDFRYAECFICKEQGHIARQCPDNPRGLYPKGGACTSCGDVTHLKRDCPKYLAEKEETTIMAGNQSGRMLESIEDDILDEVSPKALKKKKKEIKF